MNKIIGKKWFVALLLSLVINNVQALIVELPATTASGGTLTSNSYTNNDIYDSAIPNSWIDGYIGDYGIGGLSGTITKVEVCYDIYTSGSRLDDSFYLLYSYDGSESAPTLLQTITANVNYADGQGGIPRCFDRTADRGSWSWAILQTLNLHINKDKQKGPDNWFMNSDYLFLRITYTPPALFPTQLDIWDQTDPQGGSIPAIAGESIAFFADYTDAGSGVPLSSATCQIAFEDTGYIFEPMPFNSGNNLFEASHIYLSDGTFAYNVSCTSSGYQPRFNNASITIQPGPTVGTDKPSYTACGFVYYEVRLYDQNEQLYTSAIDTNISISNASETLQSDIVSISNGIYRGSYLLPVYANAGNWLIRAISGAVGDKIFHVRTGNDDIWKINLILNSQGAYSSTDTTAASFTIINLKGVGVAGLTPQANLLIYRDNSRYSPIVTDHANGTYSFLMDFSGLSINFPHTLEVIANSSNVNVSNTIGFYVSG